MTSSASKNDRFTLPYSEKMALRGTLRELLTRYTKTNENRVLSIAIHFDKAEKKTSAKSTAIDGLSAPEECAATFRAEILPLKPLRGVDVNNTDDNLAQMKKDARNSPESLLDSSVSVTTSTYVSFPLYLPDEEPFEFCGRSSDSTWSTITLFGEQVPSKPPRRYIDRDGDVYSMHSSRSRELPMGEKYAVEMVEKGKSGVRLIERSFGYGNKVDYGDTKSFTSEIGQYQQKTDSEEAPKSDPTLQSTTTSLISEIEPEEDVEEYVGKEVHTEGGRLDKAFTQGGSVQMAAAGNGGVDGDDSSVVTLQVGFPMEK